MHHGIGVKAHKQIINSWTIANIGFAEPIARMLLYRSERCQVPGIGQFIHDEQFVWSFGNKVSDQRRSNKTCSAGNDNFHSKSFWSHSWPGMFNGSSGLPSYKNGLSKSLSRGSCRSLSERMIALAGAGPGKPISGSSQRIPPSAAGV